MVLPQTNLYCVVNFGGFEYNYILKKVSKSGDGQEGGMATGGQEKKNKATKQKMER